MANEKNPKLDENGQPIGAVTAVVGAEPPALTSGSGSNTLVPGQKLAPRKAEAMPGAVIPESESTFFNKKTGLYEGQKLVNSKGLIERDQYSSDEAYSVLASYTPVERRGLLNRFQQLGIYGKSKPSNSGFATRDLSAMREAMLYANSKGYTLDVATTMMVAEPGFSSGGGAARVRTTPKQDLTAVFRQASSSILGRQMSDAQLAKFVKAYNSMEMAEATGGAITPNVNVAAEQFVQTGAPEESTAMGALTLTNIIDKAIKGLG